MGKVDEELLEAAASTASFVPTSSWWVEQISLELPFMKRRASLPGKERRDDAAGVAGRRAAVHTR